jgi:hypothetical protein
MAPHEMNQGRSILGTLKSILYIMIGIVVLFVLLVAGSDVYCHNDINYWLPEYPNSEVLEVEREGFFRQRGMGLMHVEYVTPDDPATVREWYTDYRREITKEMNPEGNPNVRAGGIAQTQYFVRENPNGEGSIITHVAECGYN